MQFPLLLCSTLIVCLLGYGLSQRRNRQRHVPIMLTAFGLDVALVLAVEITRHAVEKAISSTNDTLLMFHVGVSTMTLLLYLCLIFFGVRVLKGKPDALPWHRRLAYLFIVCRLTNYVTSFWVG